MERGEEVGEEFVVAVRRFDEELRLALRLRARFELLEALGAFGRGNGEIAVEGKTLAVEARTHHGKENGRRPHEGHHFQAFALANGHHVGTGVGHGRTTRLANHAHRLAAAQRFEVLAETGGIGVLAHGIKLKGIDVDVATDLFEETAGSAHFFHNEVAQAEHDFRIAGRQDPVERSVAEGHGNEIEGSHGREKGWRLEPGQRAELLAAFEIILEEEAEAAALRNLCAIDGTGKVFAARGFKFGTEAAVFASGPHHGLEVVQLSLE